MKKLITLFLCTVMFISAFTGCGVVGDKSKNTTESNVKHTGKKINGEIIAASSFSEGLAFVCVDNNQEKTYCINKDGYIVFELDENISINGEISDKFTNGFAVLNAHSTNKNILCDTNGNIKTPEDIGVSNFSELGLEGGYLIVEKITSDYSSSKKEMGVMNTNFEWVVDLSESIYNEIGGIQITPLYNNSFFYNDICYFDYCEKCLNLKTGEVSYNVDFELPSNLWQSYTDCTYRDYNENTVLDLSNVDNLTNVGKFIKGKAPVKFYNEQSGTYFFTLINETGEFLFEPIEADKIANISFDGEYIVIIGDIVRSNKNLKCYDTNGTLLGQLDTSTIAKNYSYTCEVSDGVITVWASYNNLQTYSSKCYYFNPDFTELF